MEDPTVQEVEFVKNVGGIFTAMITQRDAVSEYSLLID